MKLTVYEICELLNEQAERFCKTYLSNGRRNKNTWEVGNVHNEKGQSLKVTLTGNKKGRWKDFATGEKGNLLTILYNHFNNDKKKAIGEAKRFLGIGDNPPLPPTPEQIAKEKDEQEAQDKARIKWATDLWEQSNSIKGTQGEKYLNRRGINLDKIGNISSLRFNPNLYCSKTHKNHPCIIAGVTDNKGKITGITRIYLDDNSLNTGKALYKSMLGKTGKAGVRFYKNKDKPKDSVIIAEGIETALSIKQTYPNSDIIACLSTSNMKNFVFDSNIKNVKIGADADNNKAGINTARTVAKKLIKQGIKCDIYTPTHGDFNDDLRELGKSELKNKYADVQFYFGRMYYYGDGVKQDYKKARKSLKNAGELGHTGAMVLLGRMYYNGDSVTQDYKKAMEYYTKASEQGHTGAMTLLGNMYEQGKGVT